MRHLPVLLNLASLAIGIACLAVLSMSYGRRREPERLSNLAFFSSYSFLMLIAFFFSYYFINVGKGLAAERAFAGLFFAGMAFVEATFYRMLVPAKDARAFPPAAVLLTSAWTAAQAGVLWLLPEALLPIPFAAAFIPFFFVIIWAMASAARAKKGTAANGESRAGRPGDRLFLLYVPIAAFAAAESYFLFRSPPPSGYALVSLPLAYAFTAVQFLRAASAKDRPGAAEGAAMTELPPSLARRAGLTAREEEMARLILQGKENKEIAAELSLSENTVRNHIYNLYRKLGIQRRMDLLRLIREEKEPAGR